MPSWRWIARISSRSETRILASSADSGSSSSRTCGSIASARASATRCCWPPESWYGIAVARVGQVDHARAARRRASGSRSFGRFADLAARSRCCRRRSCSGTARRTGRPCRRCAGWAAGCVMSLPSIVIVPAVGCSKPAIMRSVVVLPQPDGPRNETNSPRSTARLKSSHGARRRRSASGRRSARGRSSVRASCVSGRRPIWIAAARAAADERDDDHRQPGQAEADERDGRRLVGPVRAEELQVRPEGRAGEEAGDVNSPMTMAKVRKAPRQERDAEVRQDDPDDDREPAGAEALRGLGQRPDVDRPQARCRRRGTCTGSDRIDVADDEQRRCCRCRCRSAAAAGVL